MHRLGGEPELLGDGLDVHATGQQLRHLPLPVGERVPVVAGELVGDVRGQVTAAVSGGAHRGDQLIRAAALGEKTLGPRLQRLLHQGRAVVHRQHHHGEARRQALEQVQPGLIRHGDVAHAQLGAAAGQTRQGFFGAAKLGNDPQIGLEVEQLGKAGADDLVIVDEGNFYHDVGLKAAARVLARPTRYPWRHSGSRGRANCEQDKRWIPPKA